MKSSWWPAVLLVGAGGFVGSVLRFAVYEAVLRIAPLANFPYGTLFVNVVGCLAIGALAGLAESRDLITPELRLFLFLGLLGGFTTFSTFGLEGFELLRDGQFPTLAANLILHVVLGLLAVGAGHALTAAR